MKQDGYRLTLDSYEKNLILHALNDLRNHQIGQERPTDPVDDLILKVSYAPPKRSKAAPGHGYGER